MTSTETPPPQFWKSTRAIFLGFIAGFVLSLGTDEVLHLLKVYPPWGEPMREPGLNFLALAYRCVYGALGSYIAAKFAPRNPMRHAMTLGGLGFVLCVIGVIATSGMDLGPRWYPISLAAVTLPCAWIGGILAKR